MERREREVMVRERENDTSLFCVKERERSRARISQAEKRSRRSCPLFAQRKQHISSPRVCMPRVSELERFFASMVRMFACV